MRRPYLWDEVKTKKSSPLLNTHRNGIWSKTALYSSAVEPGLGYRRVAYDALVADRARINPDDRLSHFLNNHCTNCVHHSSFLKEQLSLVAKVCLPHNVELSWTLLVSHQWLRSGSSSGG